MWAVCWSPVGDEPQSGQKDAESMLNCGVEVSSSGPTRDLCDSRHTFPFLDL